MASSHAKSHFEKAPVDIVHLILLHLDAWDTLKCGMLNRYFQEIIASFTDLQYKVELFKANKVDSGSSAGIAARLAAIKRDHERRVGASPSGSTCSGTIVKLKVSLAGEEVAYYTGGIVGFHVPGDETVQLAQISSNSSSGELVVKEWTLENIGFQVDVLGFCPKQDLLVGVCGFGRPGPMIIHLRSLGDGRPHPFAQDPKMEWYHSFLAPRLVRKIKIHGDYCGMSYTDMSPEAVSGCHLMLYVWNWRTGERILEIYDYSILGFRFLDEDHVMIAHSPRGSSARLEIVQLSTRHPSQARTRCEFVLPPLPEERNACAGEVPSWCIVDEFDNSDPSLLEESYFHPCPDNDIIMFRAFYCDIKNPDMFCILVVPRKTFTTLLASPNHPDSPHIIPWTEWCPYGLFWIGVPWSAEFMSCGMKMLLTSNIHNDNTAEVYDFYAPFVRWRKSKGLGNDGLNPTFVEFPACPEFPYSRQLIALPRQGWERARTIFAGDFLITQSPSRNVYVFKI